MWHIHRVVVRLTLDILGLHGINMDEELLQHRLEDMDDRLKECNKQLYRIADVLERLLKISEMSR